MKTTTIIIGEPDEPPGIVSALEGTSNKPEFSRHTSELLCGLSRGKRSVVLRCLGYGNLYFNGQSCQSSVVHLP